MQQNLLLCPNRQHNAIGGPVATLKTILSALLDTEVRYLCVELQVVLHRVFYVHFSQLSMPYADDSSIQKHNYYL